MSSSRIPTWSDEDRPGALSPRTFSIATFALCGFANLGSIGMQIGALERWCPIAATTWRGLVSGRCWREHGEPDVGEHCVDADQVECRCASA